MADLPKPERKRGYALNLASVTLLLIWVMFPLAGLLIDLPAVQRARSEMWIGVVALLVAPPFIAFVLSYLAHFAAGRSRWAANAMFITIMVLAFLGRFAMSFPRRPQ
jgi:L-asparagine transporter-like permease